MTHASGSRPFSVVVLIVATLILSGSAVSQANLQGQWSTLPYPMPINPVHAALMKNGKVLIVSGSGNDPANFTNFLKAGIWDPVSGTITTQNVSWDMFCNGMVVLPDGRPFINGGTLQYDPFHGESRNAVFDPDTNTFTNVGSMAHGRWYPTPTVLGDGRVMTLSGLTETGGTNTTVEIYKVETGWSAPTPTGWTPPLYPRMHLLPSGKVFYSGSTATSRMFDPSTGGWSTVGTTRYSGSRTYGTSVLLPLSPANNYAAKVMIFGGGNPSTATTEVIDFTAPTPAWNWGPNMSQPRIEMSGVILPNGKVVALGGSLNDEDTSTASLNADLFDPATNTMSSAGANAYARLYHSVALLLPDATVWFAGGNPMRGAYEQTMEIYKPAYLFTTDGSGNVVPAIRPTIVSAPSTISYGNTFTVQTDAPDIVHAVLIRPGSPTHAFDQEQRSVAMSFTTGAGSMTVTAPPSGNIAPPGYYMLFVLNSAGVPSIASFVQLAEAPSAPDFSVGATPSSQSVIAGSGTSYNFSVTPSNGFNGTVGFSVSGLPAGASVSFNPTSVTASGTSVMSVSTQASTPTGTYPLTITATSGSLVHTASATLVITGGPANFAILVSPSSQTIQRNSSAKYQVSITASNGFTGSVQLTVSGLPARTNRSFSTNPVSGSGTSMLSIKALPKAPTGTYNLTITGTSGSLVHSVSTTLVIQ